MIRPGADPRFAFSAEDWAPDSYLWAEPDRVLVSLVIAKRPGTGALTRLFESIEAAGIAIAVPNPLGTMRGILKRWGFARRVEFSDTMGTCEVWMKPVPRGEL